MKKLNLLTIILLLILILFRNNILIFFNNFYNMLFFKNDYESAEIQILNEKIKYLENEYNTLNDFKENLPLYANYNYVVTRKIYQENYLLNSKLVIEGGSDKNFKKGMAVISESGLVGIISKVESSVSEVNTLLNIDNLSVSINGFYGKLLYKDGKFLVQDISRENLINLNDEVYTSTMGNIKEKLYIGKVTSVKDGVIEKEIVVSSSVDFNNLNYLLVVGDL